MYLHVSIQSLLVLKISVTNSAFHRWNRTTEKEENLDKSNIRKVIEIIFLCNSISIPFQFFLYFSHFLFFLAKLIFM